MKKTMTLLLLSVLALVGCEGPTDPTPTLPSNNQSVTVIVGPNNSGNGGNTPGADAACAGITGNAFITYFSGNNFGGGKAKVGEILLARVDGLTIPSNCTPTVDAHPNGQCAKLGSFHSVQQITLVPTAAGSCTLDVCVNGNKCAPAKSIDVME